jgi:hypothetical protein
MYPGGKSENQRAAKKRKINGFRYNKGEQYVNTYILHTVWAT